MPTDLASAIRKLSRALSRAATAAFADSGVGPRQVAVLRELRAGPASQVDLARSTVTDPAAMMRTIDALERRGWVHRSSSDQDRRRKLVSLTAAGTAALAELDVVTERFLSLANATLPAGDRRRFCELAEAAAAGLESAADAAPAPEPSLPGTRAHRRRTEKR